LADFRLNAQEFESVRSSPMDEALKANFLTERVKDAAKTLSKVVAEHGSINPVDSLHPGLIILYFDEAHGLHDLYNANTEASRNPTRYSALCWVLDLLRESNFFSLFLSTNSNLAHFAPKLDDYPSSRKTDDLHLQAPFTEMSLAKKDNEVYREELKVEKLMDLCFMADMGRPL
jgi:hypothetical protein